MISDHKKQISLTEYLFNSDDCACGDGDKNQRPYHILYFFLKPEIWVLCNSDLPGAHIPLQLYVQSVM